MNWLNRLERKFGHHAVPNLTFGLIACYAVGYVIALFLPNFLSYLTLEPYMVFHGQIWRLVTWIFVPSGGSIIGIVIMMFFYYSIGRQLEMTWGEFRYNVYIFAGIIFTIIGAFVLYFLTGSVFLGMYFTPYYLYLSIFLAFAACYPNMEVMLYFILPIKMKWMAVVYAVVVGYDLLRGNIAIRVVIIASLLNFIIFYFSSRNMKPYSPKEQIRKKKFRKEVNKARMSANNAGPGPHHRCAVCGRTELDDPKLEFRYCSKCNGNYEYCQDHLFTHQHVK